MTKKKIEVEIYSYGIYSKWDKKSSDLPKIVEFTHDVPAILDTEFGYVIKIKKGKGAKISYRIEHPPIKNKDGNLMPVFKGTEYVKSNDYSFFIGDCIWDPVGEKIGKWRIITWLDDKKVADETFFVCSAK